MNRIAPALDAKWSELGRAAAEMCVRLPVAAGAAGLAKELARIAPQFVFRDVLARGGWYRLGGVIDAAGGRVADDLAQWAESALAARGDDLAALADDHADSGLKATRLTGRTHYLVAAAGAQAADFLQIEIEELQEVVSHELFAGEVPGSLEELVDPPRAGEAAATPVGLPFYALRRITDAAGFLARMRVQKPEPQAVHRFVAAWQESSAGHATQFANHWVLAVREHLDRYRQPILDATPVAAMNGLPPRFEGGFGARGLALHEALQRFDRQAGYPMAWFFHMLTTRTVPHAVAAAVVEDMQAGFGYLPERDLATVKAWLFRPYGF
jgi:hypothetical protein